ncbi:flavin reductase family protein, partial [Streptomyces tricolor]
MAADDFRDLMSRFPSGVTVVTARGPGGEPVGMTCSSVASVCTDPPTLLVCLRSDSATLAAVRTGVEDGLQRHGIEAERTHPLRTHGDLPAVAVVPIAGRHVVGEELD